MLRREYAALVQGVVRYVIMRPGHGRLARLFHRQAAEMDRCYPVRLRGISNQPTAAPSFVIIIILLNNNIIIHQQINVVFSPNTTRTRNTHKKRRVR